ncbi:MAG: hypothetical protein R3E12_02845 [Candidatus Eisenbacteria bacterium]
MTRANSERCLSKLGVGVEAERATVGDQIERRSAEALRPHDAARSGLERAYRCGEPRLPCQARALRRLEEKVHRPRDDEIGGQEIRH